MSKKWYVGNYRRNLVDMHIEDWDESFLSKLDPEKYISLLKKSNAQTAMLYANSHVGLCYWPTQHGKMHRGLKGRDFLGEMIKKCHDEKLSVVVYFTLVFDNWAYDHDPSWRTVNEHGQYSRVHSEERLFLGLRYGTCCPNNMDYRKYVFSQLGELCDKYEFEGMFLDMTFWPVTCYCPSCRERYANEVGGEMPDVINWNDEKWQGFQKKREQWLAEYANAITSFIKDKNPGLTVEHQYSPVVYNWKWGVTDNIPLASDYSGGDFYGGIPQQPFICKIYRNTTVNEPFEYMTSRCDPNLNHHTNTKSKQNLAVHTYVALAHNGAFLFIDAIDPDGTLHTKVYDTMGEIFGESKQYEPYAGGKLCRDAAIYYPLTAKFDTEYNGRSVKEQTAGHMYPQIDAGLGAADTLKTNNIPFDIITRGNLNDTKDLKVMILPNINCLDDEEAGRIKEFVEQGGCMYVSGCPKSQILMEMLGIEYIGDTKEKITYIKPKCGMEFLMPNIEEGAPLTVKGSQCLVRAANQNEAAATVVLPYTEPSNHKKFASIHSNPPGIETDYPAVIYKNYGKGRIVWTAAAIEASKSADSKEIFINIIKVLCDNLFVFTSNAPAPVEILMFDQPYEGRYILHLINEQEFEPLVAAHNIDITIGITDKKVKNVFLMPNHEEIPFETEDDFVKLTVDKLDIYYMIAVYYE